MASELARLRQASPGWQVLVAINRGHSSSALSLSWLG